MLSYLKAIVGAVIAGLGSLYQALDNGHVTAQEWVSTAIATLTALAVVWGVPNLPAIAARRRSQRGAGEVDLLVRVVVLIIVVAFAIWLVRVLLHA